jgi:glucokinase
MSESYVGIEIGGTKCQVVLGNRDGVILERRRYAVEPERGAGAIREWIADRLLEFARERPLAVGVGFGGPVDVDTGRVSLSYQVEGWTNFEIRTWLANLCNFAVRVDNDANTAALGEALCGAGRGNRLCFYTTLGSGMGGGMVVDGQIYHGARPGESEVGLMTIDLAGHTAEEFCCGWAVDKKVRKNVAENPDGMLAELTAGATRGEARFLLPAIERGDAPARAILEGTAEHIALALSVVSHLFHPEVLIIGGGLALIGEPLRKAVAERLPRFMTEALKPGPAVLLSTLKEDAVCVGALLLAMQAAGPN